MIIKRIKEAEKPLLIITPKHYQTQILKTLSKEMIFKAVTFMQKKDLFEKVFFKLHEEALIKASIFLGLKPSIVKPMLKMLHKVDESKQYDTPNLTQLKQLKRYLIEHQYIIPFAHQAMFFNQYDVLISGYDHDYEMNDLVQNIQKFTDVEFMKHPLNHKQDITYTVFETIEDELNHMMIELHRLLEMNVRTDEIAIVTPPSDYEVPVKVYADFYKIPLDYKNECSLMQFPLTHQLMALLEELDTPDLKTRFDYAIESLKNRSKGHPFTAKLLQKLIQTLNPMVRFNVDYPTLKPFLQDQLKATSIVTDQAKGRILVTNLDNIDLTQYTHIFYPGVYEGHFPIIKSEDDFLDADEKRLIGYPDAQTMNDETKQKIIFKSLRINRLYLSFAKRSNQARYFPSNLMDELKELTAIQDGKPLSVDKQTYSDKAALIHTKTLYDHYVTFHEESDALTKLYPTFKNAFNQYDTQFEPIKEDTLSKLIGNELSLSYTKLNHFFECKFKYLLNDLLRIDPMESSIHMDLGNIFHALFEKHMDADHLTKAMIEAVIDQTVSENNMDAKTMFYLKRMVEPVQEAFTIIKQQHHQTDFVIDALEAKIEKTFTHKEKPVILRGVIDKLMRLDTALDPRYLIIDYKTGSETLNVNHAVLGMHAQLLYYVYLLKTKIPGALVSGIFEQTVYPKVMNQIKGKTYEEQTKDALRLKGYFEADDSIIKKIDNDYLNQSMIKGLKVKKSGEFYKGVPAYEQEALTHAVDHIEQLMFEAIDDIFSKDFTINPIHDGKKLLSCEYCAFKDICFKKPIHYRNVDLGKNIFKLHEEGKDGR